jgi:hypothetical protein
MSDKPYTVVQDPEETIIPSNSFAPDRPIFAVNVTANASTASVPTAGDELALNMGSEGPGSNKLASVLDWLGNTYSQSFWGSIGLVAAGAALLGLGIWLATRGGSSTAQAQNPANVTSPQTATAAISSIKSDLSSTSSQLASAGFNKNQIQTTSNMILLTRGSAIAGAARSASISASSVAGSDGSNGAFMTVTGNTSPAQYANLNQLNMDAYFTSISQKQSRASILANSAAVHGLTVQSNP